MKCKYGNTWLTGTPWQEGCGEVEWSADQLVDVVALIGAATPLVAGRGNVADKVPVPITLSFPTAEAALQYCATLPWLLPADGELRFEEGELLLVFPKAAFRNVQRKRRGTSVDVVFEFAVSGPPVVTTGGEPEEPGGGPVEVQYVLSAAELTGLEYMAWIPAGTLPTGAKLLTVSGAFEKLSGQWVAPTDLTVAIGASAPDFDAYYPGGWSGLALVGATSALDPGFTGIRERWLPVNDTFVPNQLYTVDLSAAQIPLAGNTVWLGNGDPWGEVGVWSGYVKVTYTT